MNKVTCFFVTIKETLYNSMFSEGLSGEIAKIAAFALGKLFVIFLGALSFIVVGTYYSPTSPLWGVSSMVFGLMIILNYLMFLREANLLAQAFLNVAIILMVVAANIGGFVGSSLSAVAGILGIVMLLICVDE